MAISRPRTIGESTDARQAVRHQVIGHGITLVGLDIDENSFGASGGVDLCQPATKSLRVSAIRTDT